ncbi:hypothetical protein KGQ72_01760 [Patescibacteria group bacterium]|nr:hypothetical protein [Patescibacteria group bacterium]
MSVRLSSAPHSSERLAARRRLRRRRIFVALFILLLILCAGAVYELRQNALRISHVQIYGADQSFADIATAAMRGYYVGLIPRDSIFFFPAGSIRADIINAHPDIAAVSIFRNGLTGLSIKVNDRVPIAWWCGAPPVLPDGLASSTPSDSCYLFDASGFVYATSSLAQPVNAFILYESPANGNPIGSTLPNAQKLPAAFDFARELDTFGSPISAIVVRADEVDDYFQSGTRVTYVLGNEQNAFTALVSARGNLNLADGSLDYVDLRFDGKVYLKRKK